MKRPPRPPQLPDSSRLPSPSHRRSPLVRAHAAAQDPQAPGTALSGTTRRAHPRSPSRCLATKWRLRDRPSSTQQPPHAPTGSFQAGAGAAAARHAGKCSLGCRHEGPYGPACPALTGVLGALSSFTPDTARNGAAATAPRNSSQCLATAHCFLMSSLKLLSV